MKCLKRRVFINKRTGQASITLPKKKLDELFGKKFPKKVQLKIVKTYW